MRGFRFAKLTRATPFVFAASLCVAQSLGQTPAWGPEVYGLRVRGQAAASAAQGDVVKVRVELEVAKDRIPADRRQITESRFASSVLELVGPDGKTTRVIPYDPTGGAGFMFPDEYTDPAKNLRDLGSLVIANSGAKP